MAMRGMTMLAALLLAGGCAAARTGGTETAMTGMDEARASLVAADRAHAADADARGTDGFAAHLADDVRYLAPGDTVIRGREAVRAWLHAHPEAAGRMRWTPVRVGVSRDGRAGYVVAVGEGTREDGTVFHPQLLSWWTRGEDGRWTVAAHLPMASPRPGAPPPDGFALHAPPPAPSPMDARGAAQAAADADTRFAAMAAREGTGAAFTAFAAPDGILVGGPTYGAEAIAESWRGSPVEIEWGPVESGGAASGDLGWTIGRAVIRAPGRPDTHSKYLSVWARQPDGRWLYVADGGTPAPPR